MSKFNVEIELTEEMLGTLPGDPEIYEKWILSKIEEPEKQEEVKEEEIKTLPQLLKESTTGFAQNNGRPFLHSYMIKGFFKSAAKAMKHVEGAASKKLGWHNSLIDTLIFIQPREIVAVLPEGGKMGYCVRALKAETPKGPRVTLARSETLPIGTKFRFTVNCLSDKLDQYIEEWFSYGEYSALGQWRNSGKGTIKYKILK